MLASIIIFEDEEEIVNYLKIKINSIIMYFENT